MDERSLVMTLQFDNKFVHTFPGEMSDGKIPRQTPAVFYARATPTPVPDPTLLLWSSGAAELLDLDEPASDKSWEASVFSGNTQLEGMEPYAVRYGGHQFGQWAGQLGDGRAIALGEVVNRQGERVEIQLKGAGPTAYSRRADGRAVLRSSVREMLCSEAMFHLRVPTTRALCLVTTGEAVLRDMFYDGHPALEPGAIVTRLAQSFLRFGNFEILAATGEIDNLKKLVDYTITLHFKGFETESPDAYLVWFHEVARRTAELMVEWLRVGFVHGVMNTDNMSILGLTIDYGPYGWLDIYDPGFTPNTTDAREKRYRFAQQPSIGLWNLARLAEALAPLMTNSEVLEAAFETYRSTFGRSYQTMMAHKLGLDQWRAQEDETLVQALDEALRSTEVDMTLFYRALADLRAEGGSVINPRLRAAFYDPNPDRHQGLEVWLAQYAKRVEGDPRSGEAVKTVMDLHNPCFIPRNYLVQEALDGLAQGDRKRLDELMLALKTPYDLNAATQKFVARRPEWARQKPGCSDLSCSS
ncbi:MAG: YdiU family protein [Chitinophagaceae bacterium]|nr:YdiU family protein [Oligoflexus sp.]